MDDQKRIIRANAATSYYAQKVVDLTNQLEDAKRSFNEAAQYKTKLVDEKYSKKEERTRLVEKLKADSYNGDEITRIANANSDCGRLSDDVIDSIVEALEHLKNKETNKLWRIVEFLGEVK